MQCKISKVLVRTGRMQLADCVEPRNKESAFPLLLEVCRSVLSVLCLEARGLWGCGLWVALYP